MTFRSYATATSGQTLYAHQETTTINGVSYYLHQLSSADGGNGTTITASAATTGRKLMGRWVYPLSGVISIPASTWTVTYRAMKSASASSVVAHGDVDILIRKSDGTIRDPIATDVANSPSLTQTNTWETLTGTYNWTAYTVVDQTDYLEVAYYIEVTTPQNGKSVSLRVDDSTLALADQTKIANIMLPSEYTLEVEFTGTSNTEDWTELVWTIDGAWTTANVSVTLQLYNYQTGQYPTSGDGYISYTSSGTPNTDETQSQTITSNPTYFRDASGNWKIKVKGVKSTTTQFDFKADLVEYKTTIYAAQAPIASFTYSPVNPLAHEIVTFNASDSYDPDGYIVSYFWDFGDGNNATTTDPIITHSYVDCGNFTVTLTVTDNDNLTDFTTADVTVINPAVLRVSLPDGTILDPDPDPWLNEGWLLNLTGASLSFTVRVNQTSNALTSYDTHLVIALDDAGYSNLTSLTVNGTAINAFQYGIPEPYGVWSWSDCVYPTWFNDTGFNLGTIQAFGYKDVVVDVTFSGPANVRIHFDAYGKVIEGTPDDPGDLAWSPHSEDSTVLATVLLVNTPPSISGLPDLELDEDTSLDNAIDLWSYASDAETPVENLIFTILSVTEPDVGVTIDSNRYIDVQPTANWYGTSEVTVQVSDGELTDTDSFNVTVNPVNDPPVASDLAISPPTPVTTDDLVGSYTYYDLEGDPESGTEIRWYKDGVLQPAYNDTLTIPSGETAKGQEWYFTVRPNDGVDFGDLQTSPTVVIGNSPPTAPVVDVTPNLPLTTDDLVCTLTTLSTDPDGDPITYTYAWYKNDALQSAYTTNTVPASATTKGDVWKCVVTPYDGTDYGPSGEDQVTIQNSPPVLDSIGDKTVNEETELSFIATATDPDADPLTFSLGAGAPAGATITSDGAFSWTPTEAQGPGSYVVRIIVSDGIDQDYEDITVTVNEVNLPPVLDPIGDKTVSEGALLQFTITASDPDIPVQTLTYSASNLPPGATFDPDTRVFSWTPTSGQAGVYSGVHFEVTDGILTDSEDITITVTAPPPPAVGGYAAPIDKSHLLAPTTGLAPWVGIAFTFLVTTAVMIVLIRHRNKILKREP